MKYIFTLFFLLYASFAQAQIIPSSFIYEFNPEAPPVLNVEVVNTYDNRTVRIETDSFKVIDANTKQEKESRELGLLVSPKSFSLSPTEKRVIRLLLRTRPTEKEEVFRVNFVPKSFSEAEEGTKKKSGINLSVLFGSGILVFAPPPNATSELSWKKVKEKLVLTNTGKKNLDIGIDAICDKDQSECKTSKLGKRLYEGQSLEVEDGPVLKISREVTSGSPQTLTIDTHEGSYKFPD